MSDKNPIQKARFNLEYMALMLASGRTDEAAQALDRCLQHLDDAAAELDRLAEIAPDPSPLLQVIRH